MPERIYLDNGATTKIYHEAIDAMMPYLYEHFENPSGLYNPAFYCKKACNDARKQIAGILNANQNEIFFTSGGTEANNWAVKGIADTYRNIGRHIITSKVEHHSILESCEALKRCDYEITYLNVDECGFIKLEELEKAIRNDTILVTIMFANNEVGTIMQVDQIAEIASRHGVIFHTDAVQAFGRLRIDVNKTKIGMLTASAHKFHGPKGTGFLYVNPKIRLNPYQDGGNQELGRRAGTENVAGIVGTALAAEKTYSDLDERHEKETKIRKNFIEKIFSNIEDVMLNGSFENRLSNNINLCFSGIEGTQIVNWLNQYGICASSGSACNSEDINPSHVLTAMNVSDEWIRGSLRITFGTDITEHEVDYVVNKLGVVVRELREIEDFK